MWRLMRMRIWEGREMAGFEEDEDVPTPPVLLSFAWIGVDLLGLSGVQ